MAIKNANRDNFNHLIGDDFTIVDFYSESCVPCKMLSRILEDLDAEIPFLNIVKLNITENEELAKEYHIMGVPTIHFYTKGQLAESHVGVLQRQALKDIVAKYLYG